MQQKLTVVKIGGNIVDNPVAANKLIEEFAALPGYKILVHGGGKVASELGSKMGIPAQMVNGRRITDAETLKIVTMVYAGLINKTLVALLQSKGCNALGLSGPDGGIIKAHKRTGSAIDYGFAGDIDSVNATQLVSFLNAGLTPVCAPITADSAGQLLNTNADTIASEIAAACSIAGCETELVFCFEKPGVMQDADNPDSVITQINAAAYTELLNSGIVHSGMIPKLDNAFKCIERGVKSVRITDAIANRGTVIS
ncbi:MAG: acetylglutamate kinase [Bacteroidota bacterium]